MFVVNITAGNLRATFGIIGPLLNLKRTSESAMPNCQNAANNGPSRVSSNWDENKSR